MRSPEYSMPKSDGFYSRLVCRGNLVMLAGVITGLFLLMIFPAAVSAGTGMNYRNARFKSLTIDDGLSQNFVAAITQDNLGFMWMGTKDGLNLYDGYRFKVFKHDPFNPFSLSDNFVTAIYCDSRGRLWVGTMNGGLNVLDRETGLFYRFTSDADNKNSLSGNHVLSITEDRNGDIWAGCNAAGLNRLQISDTTAFPSPGNVSLSRILHRADDIQLAGTAVLSLVTDHNHTLWIGTDQHILAADLSGEEPDFTVVPIRLSNHTEYISGYPVEAESAGRVLFKDSDRQMWMLNRFGLFRFDSIQSQFVQYQLADPSYDLFRCLTASAFDNRGRKEIWLCREDKLVIVNTQSGAVTEIRHDKNRADGLQAGHLISLLQDKSGTMWVGSNGYGITLYDPYSSRFGYPDDQYHAANGKVISSRDLSVRSFFISEGEDNILWLGSNEGFFRIDRASSLMEMITTARGNINDQGLIVYSITGDNDGNLWLGTSWGLIFFNPESKYSKVYDPGIRDPEGNFDARISKVFMRGKEIWTLTPYSVALFNPEKESFRHFHFNQEPVNRFSEMKYPCSYLDAEENFWLGTPNGLQYFNISTGEFTRYSNDPDDPESLAFNDIRAIVPDPQQPGLCLWLATGGGGISRFDLATRKFRSYAKPQGLTNSMVYGMLPDDNGHLWMSTNHGLFVFDSIREEFLNYNVSDGLQSNEFNSGAFFQSHRGELFFGGIKGYNSFLPGQMEQKKFDAPVVFTGFNVLESTGETGSSTVDAFLNGKGQVILPHHQNYFTIEFATLDYYSDSKKKYAYSFSKKGEQWVDLQSNRSISFADIKPGRYLLKVRGTNSDGAWSNKVAILTILIRNPWYLTMGAYLTYVLLLFLAIIGMRKFELSRIMLRNRIRIADIEAQKLKEVNQMKSEFFANISHEFRTPLTLIKGPLDNLIEGTTDREQKKIFLLMRKNAENLLALINQLLDLSRLESRQFKLSALPGDIVGFLNSLVSSFSLVAAQKNIRLTFLADPTSLDPGLKENFYYDRDVFQKIINNLISNAIKFTPANGKVTVGVLVRNLEAKGKKVEISVADTGIGIPKDKLPFIYDRFYQVDSSSKKSYEGWGIGLAYARQLADAHGATIHVESKTGEGTVFTLRFPVGKEHYGDAPETAIQGLNTEIALIEPPAYPEVYADNENRTAGSEKPVVLVVEDHSDVRRFICETLVNEYTYMEASNGQTGLTLAFEVIPDLVISDVMMPGMDGFEFCQALKSSDKTSHVPVILLTAKASHDDRIQGLESGADDYLTKPFSTRELLARIRNLTESRQLLRERFGSRVTIRPSEISVSSRDQQFMEKLLKAVEKNINNERFSVEDLAGEVAMSQAQLHRKMKALVNQSAIQFIRAVRMQRARDLLEQDAGSIGEIAWQVGYGDPGYFTRSFKDFFGELPSAVRKKG